MPRVVVPRYFELTLPGLVFSGYAFFLGQRLLLYATPPQNPLCYAALLALTAAATLAAVRRAHPAVRVALQVAWVGFYAATNAYACYEF